MHTLAEIVDIRRHGASFSEVVDAILRSSHLFREFTFRDLLDRSGITPEHGHLNMASDAWLSLSFDEQYRYAKDYQSWYASIQGIYLTYNFLPIIERCRIPMVLIPPGTFLRRYWPSDNGILCHYTKPFWCSKYPITNEQWFTVMERIYYIRKPTFPMVRLWLNDCTQFCSEANRVVHINTPLKLLENQAQWEYACHAGVHAYWPYVTGTELLKYGWFEENSDNRTHPVGKKLPNAWGLYDMLGNVCEYVADGRISGASYREPVYQVDIGKPEPLSAYASDVGFRVCGPVAPHLLKYSN